MAWFTVSSPQPDSGFDAGRERLAAIALALTGRVGWKLIGRLSDHFGSLQAAAGGDTAELRAVKGIGTQIAAHIAGIDLDQVATQIRQWNADGITVVSWLDATYPAALAPLEDRPLVLFAKSATLPAGSLSLDPAVSQSVAIVGTREASSESLRLAYTWAAALATRGWTVISGLARGVDTAAHLGALAARGCTRAVLGCGVNVAYPPENHTLAARVVASGALISEMQPDAPPSPSALMRRNRLIVGLSRAVIIVQAGETSGALHAARFAHDFGRPVYAVDNSAGNAALLRDYARPLPENVDLLLAELEP